MNVSQYILNRKPESHRLKTEAERDVPKKKKKKVSGSQDFKYHMVYMVYHIQIQ